MNEPNPSIELKNRTLVLLAFFEPFNEFDREEKCRTRFGSIDPNDRNIFSAVVAKEFFFDDFYRKIPIETKLNLSVVLVDALDDPNFNFEWLIEEASGSFGLPSTWSIKNHRQLFEEVYRHVYGIWKNDLGAIGFILPELNALGIDSQ